MSGQPVCPECNTVVEPKWEWCHNCGFDPDGKRPAGSSLLSSTSTSTVSAPSSLAGGATRGLLGDSGTYGTGSPGTDPLALPAAGDRPVSGPPSGAAPAFDALAAPTPASFAPPPPPDASASIEQSASFDMSAIFDKPPASGAPPPIDDVEPFDMSAIYGASTTFDPFDAPTPGSFGGEDEVGPGGAFDALQSVTGPAAPLPDWDSSAPPTPPPAALADDAPPAPPPGDAPVGQWPGLSGRLTPKGQARPIGAPGTKLPRSLRSRRSVPPSVVRGALIAVATLVVLGMLTLFVASTRDGPRSASPTTTLDPSAPPPIGQLPLGGRSTGADPAPAPVLDVGWTIFRAPDDTFSVNFPVAPQGRAIEAVPAMLIEGGYEATAVEGPASFVVVASDMAPAFVFDPAAELAAANWVDAGIYEVSPGIVATSFVSNPDAPEARGFVLMKGSRLFRVVATGATNEDFHSFIHGFRWIADPA